MLKLIGATLSGSATMGVVAYLDQKRKKDRGK